MPEATELDHLVAARTSSDKFAFPVEVRHYAEGVHTSACVDYVRLGLEAVRFCGHG